MRLVFLAEEEETDRALTLPSVRTKSEVKPGRELVPEPWSQTSSPQNCKKLISGVLPTQSVLFCYGGLSWLIQFHVIIWACSLSPKFIFNLSAETDLSNSEAKI